MKTVCCFICLMFYHMVDAQHVHTALSAALKSLESDAQFKHAAISVYVIDSKTGKVVFEKNAGMGLVPASCQKIITGAAAFALLGNTYRFKTELGYDGEIRDSTLYGNLIFKGYGDPSLGSLRFRMYDNFYFLDFFKSVQSLGIKEIKGTVYADDSKFEFQNVPKGWVWEDVGNYYGAGAGAFNWNENSYSLLLRSGKNIGDSVEIIAQPGVQYKSFLNNLKTAKAGSGDNAVIFLAPRSDEGSLEGTIPANENRFVIRGAVPELTADFLDQFKIFLDYHKIKHDPKLFRGYYDLKMYSDTLKYAFKKIATQFSPSLDSINYWFLKKSINLYGEAFVKTIAYEKEKFGSSEAGIKCIKDFWSKNGIESSALNIIDGSGLSPSNRVTTKTLVSVLQYAKKQKWFPSFFNALPEMNGIKMKDGYISGVRSYAGYIRSKNGNDYIFSFIVNNFDGSASMAREKIWKLLDLLK
ncbi:MAG: D-alanyl-D-alanine carboxypeptidase/D-alanyl-D-alanine-endopeptidase [Chitinophagaceae bacterium]|nr:D-alanyl-D-alanine carboxypeptidase/D-alanyl-D-alanine-endopeptidase [Chitinophagaceae bacterium]